MKAIIQRVTKASVTVGDEVVSSIGRGLCVLVGISKDDTAADVQYMVKKILNLRLFEDENNKSWSKNVMDKNYEVLCVSQFTLSYVLKGNKPDFHQAMPAEQSQAMYSSFLQQMRAAYTDSCIKDGKFQAYMQVHIQNDGPVTIPLDSPANLKNDHKVMKAEKSLARIPKSGKSSSSPQSGPVAEAAAAGSATTQQS